MNNIITCALPYVNGNLHVGHFFEATCADIKSRFLKDQKISHYFVAGDDCHGAATTIFCEQNNLDIEEHIQKQHKEHKSSYDYLGIEFCNFSKTNSQLHHQVVNWSIEQIIDNSKKLNVEFFSTKKVLSWFDDEKQQFLPDRYVKGICPHCLAKNQSPEICEFCSKEIIPSTLIEPYSKNNHHKVCLKETTHLILNTTGFYENVVYHKELLHSSIVNKVLDPSNKERSFVDISRDSPYYGIPVTQFTELKNQNYYVWFDAPLGYITFAFEVYLKEKNLIPSKEIYLKFISNLNFEHFIGKDIVYFHTFLWINILRFVDEKIKIEQINTHGWLTFKDKKFSKSDNDAFSLGDFDNQQISALRLYFFSKHDGSIQDIQFDELEVTEIYNRIIVNGLANFYARSVKLLDNNSLKVSINEVDIDANYKKLFRSSNYKKIFELISEDLSELNTHFQDLQLWKSQDKKHIQFNLELLLNKWYKLYQVLTLVCPDLLKNKEEILSLSFLHIASKLKKFINFEKID